MITDAFFRRACLAGASLTTAAVFSLGLGLVFGLAAEARADSGDFWASWGDGKAELSGYRLRMPRYGQPRAGSLVLIYVTEDFSDSRRVKAEHLGRHPASDVYPVLKLNSIRKFQTGIYDYSVMTSVFARLDFAATERPFPLRKLSLSSQEWCGHVYHQVLPPAATAARALPWQSTSHSYFDGEADDQRALPAPPGEVVAEDELPLLLRSYAGRREFLAPGESRTVAFLPSLVRARLLHQPLAFTSAVITRQGAPVAFKTPAGEVAVIAYTVAVRDGDRALYHFAAAPPHRLVHYSWDSGEEATLLGSTRLPYWQLHDNGHEALLKELGLGLPRN